MNNLTEEQITLLSGVLNTLDECEQFFRLRDRMNARVHLARPRYSPITKEVTKAIRDLHVLLDVPGDERGLEEEEEGEPESEVGFAPRDY